MPVFEYVALNESGKQVKGTLEAESSRVARQRLRTQGLFPSDIREASERASRSSRDVSKFFRSERVGAKSLALITRQLGTLVVAGIPLVEALQGVAEQTEKITTKRILSTVREEVLAGSSFAKALQKYPQVFPRLYINMVSAGESSGNLDTVLVNLASYLEAQLELRQKVVSSLFYPILMLAFCLLVVFGLLTFVVPKIVEMFTRQGAILPLPTRILIGISNIFLSYWYLLFAGIGILVYAFRSYRKQPQGKANLDKLLLRLPLIGPMYSKVATARVASTLGALLTGGVGLLEALDIVKNIINNDLLIAALEEAKDGVREGKSLSKEISKSRLFPSMLSQMIAIGERSGQLEPMLVKAGETYQKEVEVSLRGLTTLIEPLMIIGLGGTIFAIVIALLMPMVNLMDVIQK